MVCIFLTPAIFAKAGISDKNVQLIQAAEKGNLTDVQTVLTNGADINTKDIAYDLTALRQQKRWVGQTYGKYLKKLAQRNNGDRSRSGNGTHGPSTWSSKAVICTPRH